VDCLTVLDLDIEDRLLMERHSKLKEKPGGTTPVSEQDLNERFAKLSTGNAVPSPFAPPRATYDEYEDPSEDQQIRNILAQVQEDVRLDSVTPKAYKSKFKDIDDDKPVNDIPTGKTNDVVVRT
jgi:hypothetical protein